MRELKSPCHGRPAVLRRNADNDRRPSRKGRLEDVVVSTGPKPPHCGRRTADRGGREITRNGSAWCVDCQDNATIFVRQKHINTEPGCQ